MSPSLWWNDSSGVVSYSDAIAKAGKGQRLFVTSGGLEPDIDRTTIGFRNDWIRSSRRSLRSGTGAILKTRTV